LILLPNSYILLSFETGATAGLQTLKLHDCGTNNASATSILAKFKKNRCKANPVGRPSAITLIIIINFT